MTIILSLYEQFCQIIFPVEIKIVEVHVFRQAVPQNDR